MISVDTSLPNEAFRRAVQAGWAEMSTDKRFSPGYNPVWSARAEWRLFLLEEVRGKEKEISLEWLRDPRYEHILKLFVPFQVGPLECTTRSPQGKISFSTLGDAKKNPRFRFDFQAFSDGKEMRVGWRCIMQQGRKSFVALDTTSAGGKQGLLAALERLSIPDKAAGAAFVNKFRGVRLKCTTAEELLWFDARLFFSAERLSIPYASESLKTLQEKGRDLLAKESVAWLANFQKAVLPYSIFNCSLRAEGLDRLLDLAGGDTPTHVSSIAPLLSSSSSTLSAALGDYIQGKGPADSDWHKVQALLALYRINPVRAHELAKELLQKRISPVEVAAAIWDRTDLPEGLQREAALILECKQENGRSESARAELRRHHYNPRRRKMAMATALTGTVGLGMIGGLFLDRYLPLTQAELPRIAALDPRLEFLQSREHKLKIVHLQKLEDLSIRVFRGVLQGVPVELLQGRPMAGEGLYINYHPRQEASELIIVNPQNIRLIDPSQKFQVSSENLASTPGIIADFYEPLWIPERRADRGTSQVRTHHLAASFTGPHLTTGSHTFLSFSGIQDPVNEPASVPPEDLHQLIRRWEDAEEGRVRVWMNFKRGDPRVGMVLGQESSQEKLIAVDLPLSSATVELYERLPSGRLVRQAVGTVDGAAIQLGFMTEVSFELDKEKAVELNSLFHRDLIVIKVRSLVRMGDQDIPIERQIPCTLTTAVLDDALERLEIKPRVHVLDERLLPGDKELIEVADELKASTLSLHRTLQDAARAATHAIWQRLWSGKWALDSKDLSLVLLAFEGEELRRTIDEITPEIAHGFYVDQEVLSTKEDESPSDKFSLRGYIGAMDASQEKQPVERRHSHGTSYYTVGVDGLRLASKQNQTGIELWEPLPSASEEADLSLEFFPSRHGGLVHSGPTALIGLGEAEFAGRLENYFSRFEEHFPQKQEDLNRARAALRRFLALPREYRLTLIQPRF